MPSLHAPVSAVLDALYGDDGGEFQARLRPLALAAQHAAPAELTSAVEQLAPVIPQLTGWGTRLAVFAGALVEWGGSPLALGEVLPARVDLTLQAYRLIQLIWAREAGGRALPAHDWAHAGEIAEIVDVVAARLDVPERYAEMLKTAWFDLDDWLKPMCTVLQRREFRAAMVGREQLRASAAAVAGDVERAYWVESLCLVLDDEPLVALDPASGRGFRLTMAGIGDNYALHTLLAAALVNDQPSPLGYEPVEPAWLAAATDGEPFLPLDAATARRFRLFDALGRYVSPEARPAEIGTLDGTRVVVLHPPLGNFRWNPGRIYVDMTPSLTVESELDPAEAAHWLARVTQADESDLFAGNPSGR